MLVLSRQRDETIMIGDDVEITVVDIRGDKVRLGITAPRHIQVHRKEVYEAIKRENQQAAKLNPRDVAPVVERDAEKKNSQSRSRDVSAKEPAVELRDTEGKTPKESGGCAPINDPGPPGSAAGAA
jgi:carbon storage regulator